MADDIIGPIHPGEHLAEFIEDFGITQYALAKAMKVQPIRISRIVNGRRTITADTSIRLERVFGQSENFWLNLQVLYDLEVAAARFADDVEPLAVSG